MEGGFTLRRRSEKVQRQGADEFDASLIATTMFGNERIASAGMTKYKIPCPQCGKPGSDPDKYGCSNCGRPAGAEQQEEGKAA